MDKIECPNCNYLSSPGSTTCDRCQKSLTVRCRVCPDCGKQNPVEAWHCSACGATLSLDTVAEVVPQDVVSDRIVSKDFESTSEGVHLPPILTPDELKTNGSTDAKIEVKGFGIRALAYIIDLVVIYGLNFVSALGLGVVLAIMMVLIGREFSFSEPQTQGVDYIVSLILSVLYFVVFEWLFGATFGKLVLGMRVIKDDGRLLDLQASVIRALFRFIDGLFFGIPAYLSMSGSSNQRLGDKKACTIVVGSRASGIQQPRAWWWFLIAAGFYLGLNTIAIAFLFVLSQS